MWGLWQSWAELPHLARRLWLLAAGAALLAGLNLALADELWLHPAATLPPSRWIVGSALLMLVLLSLVWAWLWTAHWAWWLRLFGRMMLLGGWALAGLLTILLLAFGL